MPLQKRKNSLEKPSFLPSAENPQSVLSLQERFVSQLDQLGFDRHSDPVLLGLSGGLDSMVLLHLLRQSGARVSIAHCNFQLRGDESDADEAFIRAVVSPVEVPSFFKRFDTSQYASKKGLSVQVAARNLRYDWWIELMHQDKILTLMTAHHANDNAETVLINWMRGTGIKGLAGIPPSLLLSSGPQQVLRPLLPFLRQELLEYAQENGIKWREDSSNSKDDYLRNYIRHQIIPNLEKVQPALLKITHRSAVYIRETATNYDYLLRQAVGFKAVGQQAYAIDISSVQQMPAPESALRDLLKPYRFTPEQARQIAGCLDRVGTDFWTTDGIRLVIDRKQILLYIHPEWNNPTPEIQINTDDLMVKVPGMGQLIFTLSNDTDFPDGKDSIVADAALLIFPLTLRTWRAGDSFQPFGMKGQHQKLQDYLTNQHLSRVDKEQVFVLVNNDQKVIWVVGFRSDERFKWTNTTRNCVKMTLIRH